MSCGTLIDVNDNPVLAMYLSRCEQPMLTNSKPKSESPRLGWTYIPLTAYAIILLGWMLLFIYYGSIGRKPVRPDFYGVMIFFFVQFALAHWALVGLFAITHAIAKNNWPKIGWVRAAMWSSLIAMLTPEILAVIYISDGIALGLTFLSFIFVLPIFGLSGWLAGFFIYYIHKRLKNTISTMPERLEHTISTVPGRLENTISTAPRRLEHFIATAPSVIFVGPLIFILFLSMLVVGCLISVR